MAAHTHTCRSCDEEFDCNAPIVRDSDAPQNVCIVVFEEGDELLCDNCESVQGELQSERRLVQ